MKRRAFTTYREEGMHRGVVLLAALAAVGLASSARADEAADAYNTLQTSSVYIAPGLQSSGHVRAGDASALQAQATASASAGAPEKFALLTTLPKRLGATSGATQRAADTLRQEVSLAGGVLVLVWPHGIGVSSDTLSTGQIESIERVAAPICHAAGYGACALAAGRAAESQVRSDRATTQHDALVFWSIVLLIIAALVGYFVWRAARLRRKIAGGLDELRAAAGNTLAMIDTVVQAIAPSAASMSPEMRQEYDRALALRDRARRACEGATTQAALIQANSDAAQSMLLLQGVTRAIDITALPALQAVDLADPRCLYCGLSDRPPYSERTIGDGQGNRLQVEVCAVCMGQLQAGRTPQMATARNDGLVMPWWAVPSSPNYSMYGGPSWQYWLPFLIGIDVGGWFGGGVYATGYGPGSGFDPAIATDGLQLAAQPGDAVPSDAAGGAANDGDTEHL
jgi:hypothetical protein